MREIKFPVPYWLMRLLGGQSFDADVTELTERAEMTGRAKRNREFFGGILSVGVEVEVQDAPQKQDGPQHE